MNFHDKIWVHYDQRKCTVLNKKSHKHFSLEPIQLTPTSWTKTLGPRVILQDFQ